MSAKTVDLNFGLINVEGKPVGIAAITVAIQMDSYINRLNLAGDTEMAELFEGFKIQLNGPSHSMTVSDDQFLIVHDWFLTKSKFYDTDQGQPFSMIKAAFDAA